MFNNILTNTNFNHINAYGPDMNLFKPAKKSGKKPAFGRAARGMNRDYAEGLQDHKLAVFEHFKRLIPELDKAFPDYNIIVRPHPTENHDVYNQIASQCERVFVTNKGNVVPWLMATKAVIHNGCTTGVEAYAMEIPAISYQATVNEDYDYGFYLLPNKISHQCFDFEQIKEYLAAQDGQLACERMLDVLEKISEDFSRPDKLPLKNRMERWAVTRGLHLAKRIKSSLPGSHNRPEFQRHRYPGISLDSLNAKLLQFQQLLGNKRELKVERISNVIFQISP